MLPQCAVVTIKPWMLLLEDLPDSWKIRWNHSEHLRRPCPSRTVEASPASSTASFKKFFQTGHGKRHWNTHAYYSGGRRTKRVIIASIHNHPTIWHRSWHKIVTVYAIYLSNSRRRAHSRPDRSIESKMPKRQQFTPKQQSIAIAGEMQIRSESRSTHKSKNTSAFIFQHKNAKNLTMRLQSRKVAKNLPHSGPCWNWCWP
jgi:hypothetical protein